MEGSADGFAVIAPVMSFPPNELGSYDLGGNVWEWCGDWFNSEKKLHVLRGASWGSSARAPPPLLLQRQTDRRPPLAQ
ncbi:MAG: formylglycine-generating enzyme family protein [Verrucomicrobiales bacterium]